MNKISVKERKSRENLTKALKIAIAAVLSIAAANMLELDNPVTAGIITVLSIQNTKRETLKTAANRAIAFVCALLLASICYKTLGFTILAFSVYLFFFSLLCLSARWGEAIVMNSVLMSHFLSAKSFSPEMVFNELMLLIIGIFFGILINLHLRRKEEEFEILSSIVDEEIKEILRRMSQKLCEEDKQGYNDNCFMRLEGKIENAKECALKNYNNTLRNVSAYELDYIKMRENQSRVLKNIYQSIIMIKKLPRQTGDISEFLNHIVLQYHRDNDVSGLLQELEEMLENVKHQELPQSRGEFEARAILFYILKQLEDFLRLKNQFIVSYRVSAKNRS